MKFKTKSQGRYGKRHTPGQMNKVEEEYSQTLERQRIAGEIAWWGFERITVKLAADCRYTSDFTLLHSDGSFEFVQVKGAGPMNETSAVKCRMAAEQFWMFKFSMEKKLTKKQAAEYGATWKRTEY